MWDIHIALDRKAQLTMNARQSYCVVLTQSNRPLTESLIFIFIETTGRNQTSIKRKERAEIKYSK